MYKRVVIFVEGDSEMIFSSYLIQVLYEYQRIKINFNSWRSDDALKYNVMPQIRLGDELEFTLYNVGNVQRVVNIIKANAQSLLKQYNVVMGLRDIISQEYENMAGNKIDFEIIERLIKNTHTLFAGDDNKGVEIFFAVMELEAWYLGLTECLERSGYNLLGIKESLGIDLEEADPEKTFYKPKKDIRRFEPNLDEKEFAHRIGSNLRLTDIERVKKEKKNSHFIRFINRLERL